MSGNDSKDQQFYCHLVKPFASFAFPIFFPWQTVASWMVEFILNQSPLLFFCVYFCFIALNYHIHIVHKHIIMVVGAIVKYSISFYLSIIFDILIQWRTTRKKYNNNKEIIDWRSLFKFVFIQYVNSVSLNE